MSDTQDKKDDDLLRAWRRFCLILIVLAALIVFSVIVLVQWLSGGR